MLRWLSSVLNKEPSWFEQNMHAQCVEPLPLCSFCSLRNLKKFCEKLQSVCMYCSYDKSVVGSVIWVPNKSGVRYELENCVPPREMVDWFNNTSEQDIKNIASKMAHDAIVQHQK